MTTTCDTPVWLNRGIQAKGCGERRNLNGDEYVCIGEFVSVDGAHVHYMRTVEDERRLAPTVT